MKNHPHSDLLILGATPGGIACAIRAAQEGLRVILAEPSAHVGGMWTSGLQGLDTRYAGHRCPVLTDFVQRVQEHYRRTFGDGSPEHAMASFGNPALHGQRPRFEARVAEQILRGMLGEHAGILLLTGRRLAAVEREAGTLRAARFELEPAAGEPERAAAEIFVDATYEGDLLAAAGAPYRVGREGRSEFGEPHAGRHLTTIEPIGDIGREIATGLNLHYFNRTSRRQFPESTGEGDAAVQAYTMRLALTDRPENLRPIERPANYDRTVFLGILDRSPEAHDKGYPLSSHYLNGDIHHLRLAATLPNGKTDWLGANFVGRNHGYPEASFEERRRIQAEHVAHALGTLYFLQNDSAVPESVRRDYSRWGLARDEFADTGNVPWTMYVREARRLRGLHVFTEHDATRSPLHGRTPIHFDSVAFAEWPMDSHDCNPVRAPESFNDGELILAEQTLPSQIPYRCLVADAVDNLLVPVCLSSTHIGWGTLRLEPVFVHTGEAAGVAAALSLRRNVAPRRLDGALLQMELLRRRIAVAYFSDLALGDGRPATAAIQFLAGRGFFPDYAARPDAALDQATADAWKAVAARTLLSPQDADYCAALVRAAGRPPDGQVAIRLAGDDRRGDVDWQVRPGEPIAAAAVRLAAQLAEGGAGPAPGAG